MKAMQATGALILFASSTLFLASCATDGGGMTRAGGTASQAGAPAVTGDMLQACLSRIPKDASPGQRMVAEESCKAEAINRGGIVTTTSSRAASGTAGDTLQACLDRIPKDASPGQRMIAEESCKRDEANRQAINLAR
jgi:hypothetical protein